MISGVVVLELIKCFCFTLTAIFHVQVEFIYLSVDGAE